MADVEVLPTGGAERRAESPDTTELAPAKTVAQLKASYNNSSSKLLASLADSPFAPSGGTSKSLASSAAASPRGGSHSQRYQPPEEATAATKKSPLSPRPKSAATPKSPQMSDRRPPSPSGGPAGASSKTDAWAAATATLLKDGSHGKKPSSNSNWTSASAALRQKEREAKMAARAAAVEEANREATAHNAALKEKEAAKKEAVRKAAADRAAVALNEAAAERKVAEERKKEKAKQQKDAAAKLWQRCKRVAELVGVDKHGDDLAAHMPASDACLSAVTKLREIVLESRRAEALDCEKVAAKALKVAERKAAALARSEQWLAQWRQAEDAEAEACKGETADEVAERSAANKAKAAKMVEAAGMAEAAFDADEEAKTEADGSSTTKPSEPAPSDGSSAVAAAAAAGPAAAVAAAPAAATAPAAPADKGKEAASKDKTAASGKKPHVPSLLAEARAALAEAPIIPVPSQTVHLIHRSLVPVLHALNHGLEEDSVEMEAARNAFRSWHSTSWLDTRSNTMKTKPVKGWTVEQYALDGFAGMYARKLHVPRVAAIRQAIVWLLQCAPGLPREAALCFADLGAGTCAACLGARLALRDLGGDEQPYRVFPIDVASSSTRFQKAFGAMTKNEKFGHAALLRGQEPSQYLTEAQPGVDCLATSLLDQLAARGEREPHILLASFSLHYLDTEERIAFYALLASKLTRPMLLVIIKGVGELQRPPSHVPSVHYGLHFYVGREAHRPRVIEAHACLILPSAAPSGRTFDVEAPYDPTDGDSWVLCTFRTLQRRCDRNGLFSGTTVLDEDLERGLVGPKLNSMATVLQPLT
jgi:hypothetical protein